MNLMRGLFLKEIPPKLVALLQQSPIFLRNKPLRMPVEYPAKGHFVQFKQQLFYKLLNMIYRACSLYLLAGKIMAKTVRKKAAAKKKAAPGKKAVSKKGSSKKNKLGVKNSLVNNINAKKKKGASKTKTKSTVSKKAYKNMEDNWGKE
jgi:hypothetical protein